MRWRRSVLMLMVALMLVASTSLALRAEPREGQTRVDLEKRLRRLLHARATTAERASKAMQAALEAATVTAFDYLDAVNRLAEARLAIAKTAAQQIAAHEKRVKRMREVERKLDLLYKRGIGGGTTLMEYATAIRERQSAEIALIEARLRAMPSGCRTDTERYPSKAALKKRLQRILQDRAKRAERAFDAMHVAFESETVTPFDYLDALSRLAEARLAVAETPAQQLAVLENLVEQVRKPERMLEVLYKGASDAHGIFKVYITAKRDRQTAEIAVIKARLQATYDRDAHGKPNRSDLEKQLARLLQERLATAKTANQAMEASFKLETVTVCDFVDAVNHLASARLAVAVTPAERIDALQERMDVLSKWELKHSGSINTRGTHSGERAFFASLTRERQTAEIALIQAQLRCGR